jgi:lysophospholipase L1-like esterase
MLSGAQARTVIAFGDSTTAPRGEVVTYPELLQRRWQHTEPPVKVINAGVRGDSTDHALMRLESDVLAHVPDVVIVRFGTNDAAVDVWATPPATAPRVALAHFERNLRLITRSAHAQGAEIVLCTPSPLTWSEITLNLYGKPPYDPNDADGFNLLLRDYVAKVRELAVKLGVALVDLDLAFRHYASESVPPWMDLLPDGMHPNDAGHQLSAELLIPILERMLNISPHPTHL